MGEKIKKLSLSSIGKNESDYLLNSVLDNSLFEVREVYREFLTRQIEEINGLNQLSLLVNKVTCKFDDFSKRFLPKNVSFGPPKSNQSQVRKLFKSNLRDIYSHLSAEIFLHQKFYIEELFELIRTVKRDFEIETKAIVDSENKKRKKKRLAGTKYYPFTNPVRVTIQDGAMFSIVLPVGEVYLANMYTAIRIKSKQKLPSTEMVSNDEYDKNSSPRIKYATHHITQFNLSDGRKGLFPELILYNRFQPVDETLHRPVEVMMGRVEYLNNVKVEAFTLLDELAVIAANLDKSKQFGAEV